MKTVMRTTTKLARARSRYYLSLVTAVALAKVFGYYRSSLKTGPARPGPAGTYKLSHRSLKTLK